MLMEGTLWLDDINSLYSHLSGVFGEGDNTAIAHPQHHYHTCLWDTELSLEWTTLRTSLWLLMFEDSL